MSKATSTGCETPDSSGGTRPVSSESDFQVALAFPPDGELSKPRWSFVRKAVFDFEDLLTLGPTWVMTEPALAFEQVISLTDPAIEFTGVELFNSTDGKSPVTFDLSQRQVKASWPGMSTNTLERWVYRLFVSREGSKTEPVHLTFATQNLTLRQQVLKQLALPAPAVPGDIVPAVDPPLGTPTFATQVEFGAEGVEFVDWFDLSGLKLPAGVLLEPQIVVKILDQLIKFQFDNPQGLFSGSDPSPCNRGGNNIPPLSIAWFGVDPPPPPPCPGPLAFLNSTVRQADTLARVLWLEPSQGEQRRTSSFFFRFSDSNAPDVEMLVDPTIVHDPDLPP